MSLVGRDVVLAIVDAVANLSHRNATRVEASELTLGAGRIHASLLVRPVLAVVLVVALPRLKDAAAIVASELVRRAGVVGAVVGVLVGVVTAVVVAVAGPHAADALAVGAEELGGIAGDVPGHAHAALVDQLGVVVAAALDRVVGCGVAAVRAATVGDLARVDLATLPARTVHVDVSRGVVQPFDHLHHIGASVFLRPVHPS